MKYVSMRMPEPGPLGETFFEAKLRAMVAASLVNRPSGGWVESVVTPATQRFLVRVRCCFDCEVRDFEFFDRGAFGRGI